MKKQRLEEAYNIHSRFHNYMGFLVCDSEKDMLALRKLVKKFQREAVKKETKKYKEEIKMLNKLIDLAQPEEWDHKLMHEDIFFGRFNGRDDDEIKPDEKFAKWFANRFAILEDSE